MSPLASLVPIYLLETKRWDFYGVFGALDFNGGHWERFPQMKKKRKMKIEGEKEEDSSLYSRAHLATHALAHARMRVRHHPWPSHLTPLLAHESPPRTRMRVRHYSTFQHLSNFFVSRVTPSSAISS